MNALRQIGEVVKYDPACDRIDTAIKAMWLLYRRGKVNILADWMQLPRAEVEARFLDFDLRYIQSDRGKIVSEKQVFRLIRSFNQEEIVRDDEGRVHVRTHNPLIVGALHMVAEYQWISRGERGGN